VPKPRNILIVDDNSLTLLTLARILEQHGYKVLATGSSSSAQELVRAQTVDLVITDYNLPDGGTELGPALKRLRPSLPVIVLSGDPAAAEAAGFADLLLAKPQEPEVLLAAIGRLLPGSHEEHAA